MSLVFSARVKGFHVGLCYRCIALGPTSGPASVSPTCSLSLIAHYLICRFQVLRLLWRTPCFPRVQAKASQYRSAPRRLHSHGHLWWKLEWRDPPASWPQPPSCPRGPTAAWCWFRALLELLVRHVYMYNPKNVWMEVLFDLYSIEYREKKKNTEELRAAMDILKVKFFKWNLAL